MAAADPNGLYRPGHDRQRPRRDPPRRVTPGSYTYWVKESFGDKPVNFVSLDRRGPLRQLAAPRPARR